MKFLQYCAVFSIGVIALPVPNQIPAFDSFGNSINKGQSPGTNHRSRSIPILLSTRGFHEVQDLKERTEDRKGSRRSEEEVADGDYDWSKAKTRGFITVDKRSGSVVSAEEAVEVDYDWHKEKTRGFITVDKRKAANIPRKESGWNHQVNDIERANLRNLGRDVDEKTRFDKDVVVTTEMQRANRKRLEENPGNVLLRG